MIIVGLVIIILGGLWLVTSRDSNIVVDTNKDNASSTVDNIEPSLPADGRYNLNSLDSLVSWRGTKTLIKGYEDTGTLKIKEGTFTIENGVVTAGTIAFDMNSIEASATTNTVAGVGNLTKHLKSADFLEVDKFPVSSFVLTTAEPVGGSAGGTFIFMGNLTIKGATNEVQFPIHFGKDNNRLVLVGEFELDRTKWGIKYGSGQFFQDLGDKIISDQVEIKFQAVADKAL